MRNKLTGVKKVVLVSRMSVYSFSEHIDAYPVAPSGEASNPVWN